VSVLAAGRLAGSRSGPTPGDCVRYPPARSSSIPDAELVIVEVAPSTPGAAGPGPRDLLVRPARPRDRAALESMFGRCTPQTIYRRFHGQVKAFPRAYLAEALAGVPAHFALVACDGPRVVALASLRLAEPGSREAAELGILIEDSWQRRGLGRKLLAGLIAHADSLGLPDLQAQMLTEEDWIMSLLSPYGECASVFSPGVREVRLRRVIAGEHGLPARHHPGAERTQDA